MKSSSSDTEKSFLNEQDAEHEKKRNDGVDLVKLTKWMKKTSWKVK